MDTPDKTTAVNVWRFNSGGLGHSSNGYDGPYSDIALTMDGQINANLITTGTLSANRIRGGIIQALDDDGVSYWNLETGAFVTGDSERSMRFVNGYLYIYAPELTNHVGSIGSFYWGGIHQEAYAGFTMLTNAKYLGIGYTVSSGSSTSVIVVNNGLNPNNITERVIIYGTSRFVSKATFEASAEFDGTAQFDDDAVFNDNVKFNSTAEATTYFYINGNDSSKRGYITGFGDSSGFTISTGDADRLVLRAGTTNILAIDNGGYGNAKTAKYFQGVFYFRDAEIEQNTYTGGQASIRLKTSPLIVGNYSLMSGYMCRFDSVYVDGALSAQTVTQRSDEHQKNIEAWNDEYAALIDDLEPIVFTWKDGEDKKQHVGLGARHTKELLKKHGLKNSGFVHVTDEDEYSLVYSELTVMLLKKVQEQQKTIDVLEKRLERLELLLNANT